MRACPVLAMHSGAPLVLDRLDQAVRAVCEAKRAIGDLTRLANSASTVDDALRLFHLAQEIEQAALGAVGVALDKADQVCGQ